MGGYRVSWGVGFIVGEGEYCHKDIWQLLSKEPRKSKGGVYLKGAGL